MMQKPYPASLLSAPLPQSGGDPAPKQRRRSSGGAFPAEPVADGVAHHQLLVAALQPGQFFREHRHALPVGAGHAGNVGAPEAALRTKSVKDPADVLVDVAV